MTREEQLHQAMIDLYQKAGKATGYWGNYYLRSVKKHGGLQTARKMLSKQAESQTGLQAVIDVGRPDLTVEYLVLQPQFSSLFTENESAEAKRRLSLVPQHAYRHAVPPENNHADEIADPSDFSEGAVKKVVVNAFERDPGARKECLKKLGLNCKVCSMSFHERYGEIGKEFIHVHHKKPLAGIRENYKVDPKKDLVPVCPNCHAMLHTSNPPLGIEELKQVLEKEGRST